MRLPSRIVESERTVQVGLQDCLSVNLVTEMTRLILAKVRMPA